VLGVAARMVDHDRGAVGTGEFAVSVFPEVVEVHGLVALELLFIDLHGLRVNASLLSLPLIWVRAQLDPIEVALDNFAAFKVERGEFAQSFDLLPQNCDLVLVPRGMRLNRARLRQACQRKRLRRDKSCLRTLVHLLKLAHDCRLALQVFVRLLTKF